MPDLVLVLVIGALVGGIVLIVLYLGRRAERKAFEERMEILARGFLKSTEPRGKPQLTGALRGHYEKLSIAFEDRAFDSQEAVEVLGLSRPYTVEILGELQNLGYAERLGWTTWAILG